MKEYLHAFNNLARYAPEFVNTDAKKIASFQRGLSPNVLKTMGTRTRATFNAYISDCLTQENNNNNYSASKSRKRAFEARSSLGHQWQDVSIIVLLPPVLGSDPAEKEYRTSNSAEAIQGSSGPAKPRAN